MKKTIIGISFLLSGLLLELSIIFVASAQLPQITSWSREYSSKLMFLIFAGFPKYSDGAYGLGLGVFFVLGAALIAMGILALLREYFSKEK